MEDEKERTMTFSQLLLLLTVLPEDVMPGDHMGGWGWRKNIN